MMIMTPGALLEYFIQSHVSIIFGAAAADKIFPSAVVSKYCHFVLHSFLEIAHFKDVKFLEALRCAYNYRH